MSVSCVRWRIWGSPSFSTQVIKMETVQCRDIWSTLDKSRTRSYHQNMSNIVCETSLIRSSCISLVELPTFFKGPVKVVTKREYIQTQTENLNISEPCCPSCNQSFSTRKPIAESLIKESKAYFSSDEADYLFTYPIRNPEKVTETTTNWPRRAITAFSVTMRTNLDAWLIVAFLRQK